VTPDETLPETDVPSRMSGLEPIHGEQEAATRGSPVILYVGRLIPAKGVDTLIRSAPHVFDVLPDAKVIVVGDGPYCEVLQSLADQLGITSRVDFAGTQRDVSPFYRKADVAAVPSLYEPFGIVAVEAMAASLPVVASNVGGLADSVVDGVTGWLVPPGDPEALADALLRILSLPDGGANMGRAGRERVLGNYTEDKMCERISELLGLEWPVNAR